MKKRIVCVLMILLMVFSMAGCSKATLLSPDEPVTLTMWHVYGEQADSPMNRLVHEFNETIGLEQGVIINITALSNTSNIGPMLRDSWNSVPGSADMPDLFFCHTNNAADIGAENLVDWSDLFTKEELNGYVDAFVAEGMLGDDLVVFPVSKSTHMLFVNGTQFSRFSKDTGITYEDLATWEGFLDVAEKYYAWSGGQTFCAMDYLLRAVELNTEAHGIDQYMNDNGWYDFENTALKKSWLQFADAIVQGHIMVSDLYSNTQMMTGEVIAGLGSSAAILYYNDVVTYPDNHSEPLDLQVLPMPKAEGCPGLATQAGVGLCALKTTEQKAEAAALFARWLTEEDRNLSFVTETGYMPVAKDAFAAIDGFSFENQGYANLYAALKDVQAEYAMVQEPNIPGYYDKVYALYGALREKQGQWKTQCAAGEDPAVFLNETLQLFQSVG